jgi:hypothetical protein
VTKSIEYGIKMSSSLKDGEVMYLLNPLSAASLRFPSVDVVYKRKQNNESHDLNKFYLHSTPES